MSFKHLSDLPESIKITLPKKAHTIYKEEINNACEEFHDSNVRSSIEEVCPRAAFPEAHNREFSIYARPLESGLFCLTDSIIKP